MTAVIPSELEARDDRMPETAVAQFERVTKRYGRRDDGIVALDDVTLRIEPGEVFALVGPNRAGKSTLIKILLSLCRPTSGRALRLGQPTSASSTLARCGYLHENQAFPRYLTAEDLLHYYGTLALIPPDVLHRRVPELLQRVGLADRRRQVIARFSKGMIQRLALAQALINDPTLLVLDEPTEGLDLAGRNLVADVVRERRDLGHTVLYVSHVLAEVERLCDRVGVLVAGRLVHVSPASDLTRDPNTGDRRSIESALQPLYETQAS